MNDMQVCIHVHEMKACMTRKCVIPCAVQVRIDMSEYMEKHSVSRLIGAPPGYVGYDEVCVHAEYIM